MKYFRNVYVKDYKSFPYSKLNGSKTLNYSGKIIYYIGELPDTYNSKTDIVFDCDCEFDEWRKLEKVFA